MCICIRSAIPVSLIQLSYFAFQAHQQADTNRQIGANGGGGGTVCRAMQRNAAYSGACVKTLREPSIQLGPSLHVGHSDYQYLPLSTAHRASNQNNRDIALSPQQSTWQTASLSTHQGLQSNPEGSLSNAGQQLEYSTRARDRAWLDRNEFEDRRRKLDNPTDAVSSFDSSAPCRINLV